MTRQEGSEEVMLEEYDAPRGQKPPLPGRRPEQLSVALRPQRGLERAVCPRSGGTNLSPIVMVQEAAQRRRHHRLPSRAVAGRQAGGGGDAGGGAEGVRREVCHEGTAASGAR